MGSEFLSNAPCREADPWLFDQSEIDLAMPGLNYCLGCKFWTECDEWIRPKNNYFEGVAAGKVWRNGRILARLDASSPHRLTIGDEPVEDAMELRGSELLGDRYGDVLRGGKTFDSGESFSKEDL